MTYPADQCPICKSKATPLDRTGDAMGFDCTEHEKFRVASTVFALPAKTREQWEAALARARQRTKPGEWPLITSYDLPGSPMNEEMSDEELRWIILEEVWKHRHEPLINFDQALNNLSIPSEIKSSILRQLEGWGLNRIQTPTAQRVGRW